MQAKKPKEIDGKMFQKWVEKGNFWFEEAPILPLNLEICQRKMVEIHKYYSPGLRFCVFDFENGYAHQVLSIPESIAHCKSQFRLLHEKPGKIRATLRKWNMVTENLLKKINELESTDLKKLSERELFREFVEFNDVLGNFWNISLTVEPYSPFIDQYYYPFFEKVAGDAKRAKEAFAQLTLPTESSFIADERKDILKMAIKFLASGKLRKNLLEKNSHDFLAEIKSENPKFFHALELHQKNFFWLQNSYAEWTVLSVSDFLDFLRDSVRQFSIQDLEKELAGLEGKEELIRKQISLILEIGLSKKTIRELEYIRTITLKRDERKKIVLIMLHQMFCFIRDFSRRSGIGEKLVAHALIHEIPALLAGKLPIHLLEERRKYCVFISQSGNRQSVLVGKNAVDFRKKVLEKGIESPDQLLGTVASRGTEAVVTGKARVILNPKGESVLRDEILVTSMTRPDFLPLMKAAKAFITNEGGITCHAAIVSREMNKPCIIGTKHATKSLKTGDEIEMRMNHGTVKILKKTSYS